MLAHAASAQGISAVENMCGRSHTLNHLSVPAACFTHPEARFHDTLAASDSTRLREQYSEECIASMSMQPSA